jgi:octaprenyl-diphosphate synthase
VVLAFERGDAEERRFWRRTLEQGEQHEGDLAHAIELLKRRDALADSLGRAAEFSEAAQRELARFVPTPARRAMLDLAEFCVERAY